MSGAYGDIRYVDGAGASSDGGRTFSVSKSNQMAADDLPYIKEYKNKIFAAARAQGNKVQTSVVAAIISRETRGGRGAGLTADGKGDNGNAFGLMQIDYRWHKPAGEWNSQEHIEQGIGVLLGSYSDVERKFPGWSANQKLKGALAAYNMGTEKMVSYEKVDAHTHNRDYSNDVTARAKFFAKNGF